MDQFAQVIKEMISLFEGFLPLEQEKLKAVQENKLTVLEDCMTKEQAVVLKLRGLEKKRETVQKEMGWEGKTFREILELVPETREREFRQLFEQLSQSISTFQSTNESALDAITVNLRQIEQTIKSKDPEGVYAQDGGSVKPDRPLTSRRV